MANGGGVRRGALLVPGDRSQELVALDDAFGALPAVDERKARAVEMYYLGGMSQREIADALSVHKNTVARDLRLAAARLHRHIMEAVDHRDRGP